MTDEKEEANIKKMATLLREGATMLNLSCPQCGNLLFRLKTSKIYCPSCNKEVIIQKENHPSPLKQDIYKNDESKPNIGQKFSFSEEIFLLHGKISELCKDLRQINQVTLIDLYSKILERLVKVYQSLININNFFVREETK